MPNKSGVMTPQERAFVPAFVATGDRQHAARVAGYAHPTKASSAALQRPAVQAEIVRLQLERLNNEVLPLAVDTLIACMRSPTAPWAAKNQAAKIGMEHSIGRQEGSAGKADHEMSAQEIQAEILRLEARKVELARPTIEGDCAPVAPNISAFD